MKAVSTVMAALLAAILLLASPGARPIEPETGESETCVILLHGLGRTPLSMVPLQIALELAGYRTVNQGYPSRGESIETLAAAHVAEALTKCDSPPDAPVHFVAHSMGGILVRQYLQDRELPAGSRMVMLGPPNRGSELVDRFGADAWFGVLGPAALQLGTETGSLPSRLDPVDLEIGVIAGTRAGLDSILLQAARMPEPNDGRVSLTSARLEEMRDFLAVDQSHSLLLIEKQVVRQVLAFLATGRFQPADDGNRQR